jgi:hypothetical protein
LFHKKIKVAQELQELLRQYGLVTGSVETFCNLEAYTLLTYFADEII